MSLYLLASPQRRGRRGDEVQALAPVLDEILPLTNWRSTRCMGSSRSQVSQPPASVNPSDRVGREQSKAGFPENETHSRQAAQRAGQRSFSSGDPQLQKAETPPIQPSLQECAAALPAIPSASRARSLFLQREPTAQPKGTQLRTEEQGTENSFSGL